MNEKNYLELDNTKNSQYFYLGVLSAKSNAFYNFLLFTVIILFASLPFIHVQVTSSAMVKIHPKKLKEHIYAPTAGRISRVSIENNQVINKGDTMLSIDNTVILGELKIIKEKEQVIDRNLHDIDKVLRASSDSSNRGLLLFQPRYQDHYQEFLEQKNQLSAKFENVSKTYERNKHLFGKKVISESEYEEFSLMYKQAKINLELLVRKFKSQWQTDRYQMLQELSDLKIKENQMDGLIKNSVIIANNSGTCYITEGLQLGTYLQGGQKIAEIVPDSGLIASCFVSPKDIAFIKIGQNLQIQIDAYNFYDWGMMQGSVFEIFKDVDIIDNKPYYAVYCKLDKPFLTLKNGYKGTIIKGMTGKANFTLSKRSLWELVFTKVVDWFHPQGNQLEN